MFTWKTHCCLKFYFGQFERSKICTEVSFTPPEVMWTLKMKLPHTEVKSQTGLSSLRVSCKCALNDDFLITQVLVHSSICHFCNITFCIYCLLRSIKSFHILLKHNSFLKHDNFTNWSNSLGIFCCGPMGKSGSDWLSTRFFFVQCSIDDDSYTSKQISAWWLVYFKLTFKNFWRNQLSVRQRHLFIIGNMLLQLRFQCLWDHFIAINFSSNGKPLILNDYGKNHPGDKSMDRGSGTITPDSVSKYGFSGTLTSLSVTKNMLPSMHQNGTKHNDNVFEFIRLFFFSFFPPIFTIAKS